MPIPFRPCFHWLAAVALGSVCLSSSARADLITFNADTTSDYLDVTIDYSDGYAVDPGPSGKWILNNPTATFAVSDKGWEINLGINLEDGVLGGSTISAPAFRMKGYGWLDDMTFQEEDGILSPILSFYSGYKFLQNGEWQGDIPKLEYIDGNGMKVRVTWNVPDQSIGLSGLVLTLLTLFGMRRRTLRR